MSIKQTTRYDDDVITGKQNDFCLETVGERIDICIEKFDRFEEFSGSSVYVVLKRQRLSCIIECGNIEELKREGAVKSDSWDLVNKSMYLRDMVNKTVENHNKILVLVQLISQEKEKLYQWRYTSETRASHTRGGGETPSSVKGDQRFVRYGSSIIAPTLTFKEQVNNPQFIVSLNENIDYEKNIKN